jgi:hypothetical protein
MYFNNEQDLFKATYESAMNEDLSKGLLQIKEQDEIIGKDGSFKKPRYRKTIDRNALPPSEDEHLKMLYRVSRYQWFLQCQPRK